MRQAVLQEMSRETNSEKPDLSELKKKVEAREVALK